MVKWAAGHWPLLALVPKPVFTTGKASGLGSGRAWVASKGTHAELKQGPEGTAGRLPHMQVSQLFPHHPSMAADLRHRAEAGEKVLKASLFRLESTASGSWTWLLPHQQALFQFKNKKQNKTLSLLSLSSSLSLRESFMLNFKIPYFFPVSKLLISQAKGFWDKGEAWKWKSVKLAAAVLVFAIED